MSFSVTARARAAVDRLKSLTPSRRSDTPEGLAEVVAALLSTAQYNWTMVDASLFPSGSLADLDMTRTDVARQWTAIRQRLASEVQAAYVAYDHDRASAFEFEMSGVRINATPHTLSTIDPVGYPRDEVTAAVLSVGAGIAPTRDGDASVPRYEPYVNPATYPSLLSFKHAVLRREVGARLSRYLDLSQLVPPMVEVLDNLILALDEVANIDFTGVLAAATDMWNVQQLHEAANAQVAAKASPRRSLPDFLRERVEVAQMRQDQDSALEQFMAFPILGRRAARANASRTWGIELEITDAAHIMIPPGYRRERDHSLRENIGDGRVYDPWEFISPVLGKTYDTSLWMLCDQARNTVKYYKAGVHVHISARRRSDGAWMTTGEVSRLLEIYALVNKLLDPVIQRKQTKEFCVPIKFDQWAQGWFTQPQSSKRRQRFMQNRSADARLNAKMWAQITHGPNHDSEHTEWKRHQEVNLQALNKYGTIEFRAMGAVYDYEYLTRWAWMLREIMNYAQSTRPLAPFYRLESMEQLLTLLSSSATEKLSSPKRKSKSKPVPTVPVRAREKVGV